jgi:glycogen debranching enzyme
MYSIRSALLALSLLVLIATRASAQQTNAATAPPPTPDDTSRGIYFDKKIYTPEPLPKFVDVRDKLPNPIIDSRPELVAMYWKCWELAFSHLRQPKPGSPYVSNYLDAAFNGNIFQWDTIFMIMFARYGNAEFPAVQSLDNLYSRQHTNGYICRELQPDGSDRYYSGPINSVNPPLFSWAEVESFHLTGDKSRFAEVLPVLEKYVDWLNTDGDPKDYNKRPDWINYGRRAADSAHQLYWNTGLGSGMDNIPRDGNGWVDMSCQMVMQYNDLATMCDELNKPDKAAAFRQQAQEIGARINKWCWNEQDGFYYDVKNDGTQFKVKTSGGFWPMIAGIASKEQSDRLVAHLKDDKEFQRPFVFPTLAADERKYDVNGGYWHGAVWAPTNFIIIKGLEKCGYEDFATESTDQYLTAMAAVFKDTGTVWENYAPEAPLRPGKPAKRDFVGWTGDGPIALLIENILGFRADGVRHRLLWRLTRTDRHGIERLHVGDATISAICAARADASAPAVIAVTTDQPFTLIVSKNGVEKPFAITAGSQQIDVP